MSFLQAITWLSVGDKVPYFAPLGKAKVGRFEILVKDQRHLLLLPADGEERRISAKEYDRVSRLLPARYTQDFDRSALKTRHSSYVIAIEHFISKQL